MGINNFFKIIIDSIGEWAGKTIISLGEEVKLTSLAGKTVCFDAPTMIYAAILALEHVDGMTDQDGNVTSHIKTILAQVLMFKKHKISQIWVFDAPTMNPLKKEELAKRKAKREASTSEKVQFKMTKKHIEDIQKLLSYMGIIYIIAPAGIEAEQYGAYLTIPKPGVGAMCEYMYSSDADVLIFGGNLLRPMYVSNSGKGKKKVYVGFKIARLLEATRLNREQLATMAVAMGSDFSEKVKGVGPASATRLARTENIDIDEKQISIRDYFLQDVSELEPTIVRGEVNTPELLEWLVSLNFDREKLTKQLGL